MGSMFVNHKEKTFVTGCRQNEFYQVPDHVEEREFSSKVAQQWQRFGYSEVSKERFAETAPKAPDPLGDLDKKFEEIVGRKFSEMTPQEIEDLTPEQKEKLKEQGVLINGHYSEDECGDCSNCDGDDKQ